MISSRLSNTEIRSANKRMKKRRRLQGTNSWSKFFMRPISFGEHTRLYVKSEKLATENLSLTIFTKIKKCNFLNFCKKSKFCSKTEVLNKV